MKAFNRSVGSLERMVLPSARRFTDLGVQPRQRLATLKEVEETPRDSCAPTIPSAARSGRRSLPSGHRRRAGTPVEAPPSAAPLESSAPPAERPH